MSGRILQVIAETELWWYLFGWGVWSYDWMLSLSVSALDCHAVFAYVLMTIIRAIFNFFEVRLQFFLFCKGIV